MKHHLFIISIALIFISGCSANSKNISFENDGRYLLSKGMALSKIKHMNSLPKYNMENLKKDVEKHVSYQKASGETWGTGRDGRVYKWNGTGWSEPNPLARLKYAEKASMDQGVWGVGSDQRVYKWNGSSWDEPNAKAGLHQISAFNNNVAIGIGHAGKLYITWNGGQSWKEFIAEHQNFSKISVGHTSQNFLWGLKAKHINNKIVYSELWYFDYSTQTLNKVPTPFVVSDISATFGANGIWAIDNTKKIYKWDGANWYQPNPKAGLYKIDSNDYGKAWGIGYDDRVFRTTTSGGSWAEPAPAARLFYISTQP